MLFFFLVVFFVATPLQETVLNGKSRWQLVTLCRPQVLSNFYYSQAHGRAVMYGECILAFIVVFEWIHKEIGGLERGILPTVKGKKMLSAPWRFWCSEGNGCIDLTGLTEFRGQSLWSVLLPLLSSAFSSLWRHLHALWVKFGPCDE